MSRLRRWTRWLFLSSRQQAEMDREIRFHLEARAADLMRHGLSREKAERQARLEFGGVEGHKEAVRQAAGLTWLTDLKADLRYATRVLRRQPVFAGVAVLSLALGIGANTLVFSVVNALVINRLPVERPHELAFIQTPNQPSLSFPAYRDIRDRNTTLAGVIGYRITPMALEHSRGASMAWGYLATGNYFEVLGVKPALGAFFNQSQDRPPEPSPIAVLSYDCWRGQFAGDPAVIGSEVRINDMPYTVIGVAPQGFVGTEVFYRPDVWVPMTMQPQVEARTSYLDNRATGNTWVLARLQPNVNRTDAQANLDVIASALSREHPHTDGGLKLTMSEPGLVGDALRGPVTAFTLGVLTLAGLVLLMACVNLAVVLAARGSDRQRELAIRLSIGAGSGRLVRQLLTETLVLAAAGGLTGLALAVVTARLLSAWRLPTALPVQFDVAADGRVFLFAFAVSLIAGLMFGVAPALQAARTNANDALKGIAAQPQRARRRWPLSDLLVAVQVGICVVLLSGSLVAIRGVQVSMTMPLGFEPRQAATLGFDVGLSGYDEGRGRDFVRRAVEAMRGLPGVEAAAYSDTLPLNIDQSNSSVVREGQVDDQMAHAVNASRFRVSPGYFKVMGTRLRAGREFDERDGPRAPRVAVINETLARALFGDQDPIGRRFRYSMSGSLIEVVGVAEDGKYQNLTESARPAVFDNIVQNYASTMRLTVRSALPPNQVVPAMRSAIANLDPTLALYEAQSLDDMLALARFPNRVAAIALGVFGVLAFILAITGLHGVVTQAVTRREKEIGIRVAIGATQAGVLRLVLGRTMVLLVAGATAGGVVIALASGLVSSVVYGASPQDPMALAGTAFGLALAGVVSCWMPARRALRVSPVAALRSE